MKKLLAIPFLAVTLMACGGKSDEDKAEEAILSTRTMAQLQQTWTIIGPAGQELACQRFHKDAEAQFKRATSTGVKLDHDTFMEWMKRTCA